MPRSSRVMSELLVDNRHSQILTSTYHIKKIKEIMKKKGGKISKRELKKQKKMELTKKKGCLKKLTKKGGLLKKK